MPVSIPSSRPKLSREEVEKIISHYNIDRDKYKVIIVGLPGYYLNSIGESGKNDRGVYDDAGFIVTPDLFAAFNFNTDPSSYRKGYGLGETKGIARVKPGAYYCWKLDLHKGKYIALCQRRGKITVIRDGINGEYEQTSEYLGINNHKGGINTTASLGCWTVPPEQWDEYINTVVDQLKQHYGDKYKEAIVPCCLIEEIERRKL